MGKDKTVTRSSALSQTRDFFKWLRRAILATWGVLRRSLRGRLRDFFHHAVLGVRRFSLRFYRILRVMARRKHGDSEWTSRIKRFAKAALAREFWVFRRKEVAGGISLGVFIALLPISGIQMLVAAVAAARFRVNVPTSMAMCWITNPATLMPILLFQFELGKKLAPIFGFASQSLTNLDAFDILSDLKSVDPKLLVSVVSVGGLGVLVSAACFAALAYVTVILLWSPLRKLFLRLHLDRIHPIEKMKKLKEKRSKAKKRSN